MHLRVERIQFGIPSGDFQIFHFPLTQMVISVTMVEVATLDKWWNKLSLSILN